MDKDTIFPPEAVCEIFYGNEWNEVSPGSFKEFKTGDGGFREGPNEYFIRYTDPDGTIVFIRDHLVGGWRIDSNLVVLTEEDREPKKELTNDV